MSDIEPMFYRVQVPVEQRDVLRFLWWPDGNYNQPLHEYRMTVHLFGAVSSPSCANFALKKTAEDHANDLEPQIASSIKKNFYVDDCLKSTATEQGAIDLVGDLRKTCAEGGFRLTQWISNKRAVMESIPAEERAKEVKDLDLNQDNLPVERALGVHWCVESDKFGFRILIKDKPFTRRGILSIVSSVYDPLGLAAPFILKAKGILQDLCRQKYAWDEKIPEEHLAKWQRWIQELPSIAKFEINRSIKPDNFGAIKEAQLNHFSDASEVGYGTSSYIRLINEEGKVHCTLLMGKARVAPLKQITIPRMELTAATVAIRVDKLLKKELEIPIDKTVYWTDSTAVLRYINNETTRFHTFVANRVAVIHDGSSTSDWKYVSSQQNPADEASRGLWVDAFLKDNRWVSGPEFLWERELPESVMPKTCQDIPDEDPEVKRKVTVSATVLSEGETTLNRFISYHSSWYKLKRHVAWILKVRSRLREKATKSHAHKVNNPEKLTVEDLEEAEKAILKYTQRRAFEKEVNALDRAQKSKDLKEKNNQVTVNKASPVYKLDPKLEDGLLKVGGRLHRAPISDEAKHPIIVPRDTHVASLIMNQVHQDTKHAGRNHMLATLRQKYWITKANSLARSVANKCVICRKQKAKVCEQKMADLPVCRLTPDDPPFTRVGVDYFGPIHVKRGRSMVKRYGVIFTCLAIRAVHLEIAHSLDTDSCINAMRRFIARRGQIREIWSDNGTNLVSTSRELKQQLDTWNQSQISSSMLQENINWHFNPPAGSHHGGVWERQIRTVRKILGVLLKTQTLDDEGLLTLMCEIESTINSRPITKVSDDINDLEALTPNHLLLLKSKPNLPAGTFEKRDTYARRRWRQVQYLANIFWKRWLAEYLPLLHERQRWSKSRRNVCVGDIVLIADNSAPRNSWPLGRVVDTFPDKGGYVRRVKVKTKTNILERPIDKLSLVLEAEQEQ